MANTQLTFRAVLVGALIGCIVTVMNLYIGLMVGWSFGGSIISAILAFAIFQGLKGFVQTPYSKLENNITQTAGSAAGSMASAAGYLAPIPAMKLMGIDISLSGLYLWTFSSAFLGVMMAVPLRRQYVEIEKLKFPTGLATANTLEALHSDSNEGMKKARALFVSGIIAFVIAVIFYFLPDAQTLWLNKLPETTIYMTLMSWSFFFMVSPVFWGVGMLIGPRVGLSLLLGALLGGLLGYYAKTQGWAPGAPTSTYNSATGEWGARGWALWTGAALMVSEALTSLILNAGVFIRSFKSTKSAIENRKDGTSTEEVPTAWWVSGLLIAGAAVMITSIFYFGIPWYLGLIAILLSIVLANVAVRSTGETDITPVGGMGKVTQLLFGSLSNSAATNLMSAGITGAGASQSADMMQDLRTGYLLGASPKKQFIAQLWGILAGASVVPIVYLLFDQVYDIGGDGSDLGAPAAKAWKAVAEVMTKGLDALPPNAMQFAIGGLVIGAIPSIIGKFSPNSKKYLPSAMAIGIAMMVGAAYSIAMALGSIFLYFWKKKNANSVERWMFTIASGLLLGEGIGGLLSAILTYFEVPDIPTMMK